MKNRIRAVIPCLVISAMSVTKLLQASGEVVMANSGNTVTTVQTVISNEDIYGSTNNMNVQTLIDTHHICMPSTLIENTGGHLIGSNEVILDVNRIQEAYVKECESPSWDKHGHINTINVLWEFLVNQQGVSKSAAASIIGVVSCEGTFGQKEGTQSSVSSISQARSQLNGSGYGVGIAQWTTTGRQQSLLRFYENANMLYPDDFHTAKMIAECCMLIEELKIYDIISDLNQEVNIEDTVGRLSVLYESYDGCFEEWDKSGGLYKYVGGNDSGKYRLEYAMGIYDYFK